MKCSLVSLIFLKRSLLFPILLFSFISLHWSLRKAFLSLLAILWNSIFNGYIFPFLLFLSLLFFSQPFVRPPQTTILSFCTSFSWGWSWSLPPPIQCHEPSSIVLQAFSLPDLIPWIYLSLPLYDRKGFDLGHTWMVSWCSLLPSFKSELGNRSPWSEPQSVPGLVFANWIELLHLWLQRI